MRSRIALGTALLALCVGAAALFAGSTFADPGGPHGSILYVSNGSGTSTPSNQKHNCDGAAYTTIGAAVAAAEAPGAKATTVVVCSGTYLEDVVIAGSNAITVDGAGNPVINALGLTNGVQVLGSGTTVDGLTVEYATGEGILVGSPTAPQGTTVSNVTISDNTVTANDRGNPYGEPLSGDAASAYGQCNANPATNDPGDCGEAIHLLSADNSTVTGNYVTGNSGGILMTDENGPTFGNTISDNTVISNSLDCGITVAGHHLGTFGPNGPVTVAPATGGIYNNTIKDNDSENNGLAAQGAGIVLATGVPGGAVYNNVVDGNTISGNGLAGVTLHAHGGAENLNGNSITNNTIGTNNLDGDPDFPPANTFTTGVTVATATSPISVTITGNTISYDHFGIFTTGPVTATISGNTNIGVTQPVGP